MADYFVFVDESGDLGKLGTSYFIVAAIQVRDETLLGRVIKRVRERKLKKKLKAVSELKAVKSSPLIRRAVLKEIARLDCSIYLLSAEKKKIFPTLLEAQDMLYNWVFRLLCQQVSGKEIKLVLDKKYNSIIKRVELESYLSRQLALRGIKVSVRQLESHSCPQLQAVDFVAWAANRKYSHGDDSYYKIIEEKVANKGRIELWH